MHLVLLVAGLAAIMIGSGFWGARTGLAEWLQSDELATHPLSCSEMRKSQFEFACVSMALCFVGTLFIPHLAIGVFFAAGAALATLPV